MHWREILIGWLPNRPAAVEVGGPPPLREFFAAGGASIASQNTFVEPSGDGPWRTFYVENQHVCEWAYRIDGGDDPIVHVIEPAAAGASWTPVCTLDDFLCSASVLEAVFGAEHGLAGACSSWDEIDDVLGLDRLDLRAPGWPPALHRFYARDGLLAFAQQDEGPAFAFAGAREAQALARLRARLDASPAWEYA